MTQIYFDNSATTQVSEAAAQAALTAMRENYGNPSSLHNRGVEAAKLLQQARQTLAQCVGGAENEIIFTGSGSEANNLAMLGVAEIHARQGGRFLLAATEHPSLAEPAKFLGQKGFDVQYIPVDGQGIIDLAALEELLTTDTVFLALHQVNNENGAVQPLAQAGALLKRKAPDAHFHVDAVQALGKLPIETLKWQADSLALSGHKIHAPKGIGALWLKTGRRLPALIKGGGQERGLRSGTENMPGIAAFAVAAQLAMDKREQNAAKMRQIKQALAQELLAIPGATLNGPPPEAGAPHILSISFPGAKSEVLLHMLETRGVYVSAGSACSAHKNTASHVLQAMGLAKDRLDSALRFSFSALNKIEEINPAAEMVRQAVAEIGALGKRRSSK